MDGHRLNHSRVDRNYFCFYHLPCWLFSSFYHYELDLEEQSGCYDRLS